MYGLDAEAKFKVGDRVTVLIDEWAPAAPKGSTGTVSNVQGDRAPRGVDVKIDGGDGFAWFFEENEVESAPAEQAKPRFKVGQLVRFTDAVPEHWWFKAGQGGVVSEVYTGETIYKYGVDVEGEDYPAYVDDEHIAPAFLPGDKVRVTKHSGYFAAGDIGEVERQDANGTVFLKHGSYQRIGLPIDADALELVVAQGASNEGQPKFKVGDRVETSGVDDAGVGEVLKVEDGWYSVKFNTWYGTCGEQESRLSLARPLTVVADKLVIDVRPCIVARVVEGTPRPSNIPYVHGSVQAATAEAERLARNNPGKEFAVYQRVAGRVAEVSYSMKEVA